MKIYNLLKLNEKWISIIGTMISIIALIISFKSCQQGNEANQIAKDLQKKEAERESSEQLRYEYLAYKLGQDLMPMAILLNPIKEWHKNVVKRHMEITKRASEVFLIVGKRRLDYVQGLVDQLKLQLDLENLFSLSDGKMSNINDPMDAIRWVEERILEVHNKRVAAAFILGSRIKLLQMYPSTFPEYSEGYEKLYNGAVFDINPALEVLGVEKSKWMKFKLKNVEAINEETDKIMLLSFELWSQKFEMHGHMYNN